MNTNKLNLNLLHALDALLSERSVTRAGEKVFISQSAMSNTLNQLRDQFEDDLLVRGPKGMELTPLAKQLQPDLSRLMGEMKQLVSKPANFDPATSERVFKVGMSDLAEFFLLPILLETLNKKAPNVQLHLEHADYVDTPGPFVSNQIELSVGCIFDGNTHLSSEELLSFSVNVIARANHPLMQKKLTLKNYLSARHIRVQYRPESNYTKIDKSLQKLGKKRNVILTVKDVIPILFMLQNTDLLATIPSFLSPRLAKKLNLSMQELPFDVPLCPTHLVWHRQNNNDPGLIWLRQQIKCAAQKANKQIDGLVLCEEQCM